MSFGLSRHYQQGRSARPEKLHSVKLPGMETYLWTDGSGNTHLKLYDTVVVSFNDRWITLRTGGYRTKMTKARMNWISRNFGLGFTVGSKSSKKSSRERLSTTEGITGREVQVAPVEPALFRRRSGERSVGDWSVEFGGEWPFDRDEVSLNRETHAVVEEDMVKPTDDHYHCKSQRHASLNNPGEGYSEDDVVEEGDITTPDHEHWYQYGRLYVTGNDLALAEAMVRDSFFPSVWFISDHGNVIPHDISKAMKIAELKAKSKLSAAQPKKYLPIDGWFERKNPAGGRKGTDDIDVEVDDQESIILFKLATSEARTWWKHNVSHGHIVGGRYVVEHRYAGDIVEGMMEDGLNVNAR